MKHYPWGSAARTSPDAWASAASATRFLEGGGSASVKYIFPTYFNKSISYFSENKETVFIHSSGTIDEVSMNGIGGGHKAESGQLFSSPTSGPKTLQSKMVNEDCKHRTVSHTL